MMNDARFYVTLPAEGWICPLCRRVWAPFVDCCRECAPPQPPVVVSRDPARPEPNTTSSSEPWSATVTSGWCGGGRQP